MRREGIVVLGALVGALMGAGPATATLPTGNLVGDPGAEQGTAAPDGSSTSSGPPLWTVSGGRALPTVVRYGTPGGFPVSPNPSVAGSQFFAGGNSSEADSYSESAMLQELDFSAAQSEIDAGHAQATVTACLGGYADQDDYAGIALQGQHKVGTSTYFDSYGKATGPSAAQRGNKTGLLPAGFTVQLPPGLVALYPIVTFDRKSGAHTYNDGYADNIQVILTAAGTPAPAALPCPTPATGSAGGGGPGGGGGSGGNTGSSTGTTKASGGTNPAAGISRVGNRLTLKGRYALVKLRCTLHDSNCKGALGLATSGLPKAKATAAKKAKATKLGSAKFTVASGKTKTIKVKIKRSTRKRLARLSTKRLKKLKITATAKIGSERTTFTLGAVRKR